MACFGERLFCQDKQFRKCKQNIEKNIHKIFKKHSARINSFVNANKIFKNIHKNIQKYSARINSFVNANKIFRILLNTVS